MAQGILTRLRFSNDQIERVEALVANHMRFMNTRQMRESTLKRFLRMENFTEHLELHRLDSLSGSGQLENYKFVLSRLADLGDRRITAQAIGDGTRPDRARVPARPNVWEDAGGGGRCAA